MGTLSTQNSQEQARIIEIATRLSVLAERDFGDKGQTFVSQEGRKIVFGIAPITLCTLSYSAAGDETTWNLTLQREDPTLPKLVGTFDNHSMAQDAFFGSIVRMCHSMMTEKEIRSFITTS